MNFDCFFLNYKFQINNIYHIFSIKKIKKKKFKEQELIIQPNTFFSI
jgi:hypothetical protein